MEPQPRRVQDLVEDQCRRWLIEQRARRSPRDNLVPPITISREFGAGGVDVGKIVAKKMGLEFWDQEILHQIAEQSGASEQMLRSIDEHRRGAVEDMINGIVFGVAYTESEYLRQLVRVVHTIAHHGRAVLMGRGAHLILSEVAALRVRVICPLELRVKRIQKERGGGADEARHEIERIDSERSAFVRHAFRREANDQIAYDLIVNTGFVTLERSADIIAAAHRAKFGDAATTTATT